MGSPTVDDRRFNGAYLFWKLNKKGFRRPIAGSKLPTHRHDTYAEAAGEAARLIGLYPASTFVIVQEVGRLKAAALMGEAA